MLIFFLFSACASAHTQSTQSGTLSTNNPWQEIKTPSSGTAEVKGGYNNGCLKGALALPPIGNGFNAVRLKRNRYFGHPSLIQFIESVAQETYQNQALWIIAGDLAQPRGGPFSSGHASHQNGLDVDFLFFDYNSYSNYPLSKSESEAFHSISVLNSKRNKLNYKIWNNKIASLIQIVAKYPSIERVFIDPLIKKELCEKSPGASWLQKLRPWWNHHDHLHARLRCPEGNHECKPQELPPMGDGCGEELASWLTPEAHTDRIKAEDTISSKPFVMPLLPESCNELLTE